MSLDLMLDKFVEAAQLLKDKHDVDIRDLLERRGVITPNNVRWQIDDQDLLDKYELKDTVIDHYKWKTDPKRRTLVQCRGNIYRKSNGKLILGGWDGYKNYRVVAVTCKNIHGELQSFKFQYHTLAFFLYNKRWPRTPVVDHKDDNKMNNSGGNLEESNYTDNHHLRKANTRSSKLPKLPKNAQESPIISLYK